jgi:hypothetical protein
MQAKLGKKKQLHAEERVLHSGELSGKFNQKRQSS